VTEMTAIEWEQCLVPSASNPELEREVRRHLGTVPTYVGYLGWCPWIVRALLHSHPGSVGLVYVTPALAEALSLVVSQDNSCRYCYAAHRATLRVMGFREEQIHRLEQHVVPAALGPASEAALELAHRVSRCDPPPTPADKRAVVDAGFDPLAVQEIIVVAAMNVWANRISTIPALPPESMESFPDRWYVKLARPIMSRVMTRRWRKGRLGEAPPNPPDRPFAYTVAALDGLPVALALGRLIDATWSSPHLSTRAKALVFAVVAHALGCGPSAHEARRLLAAEGMDDERLAPVLANLASPELDEIESLIVPFARETVRYQPAQIQRRARLLAEKLSTEQFVELAAVTGLANALCRASILVAEH
jgi:AhpD family alkylhydroperoxidase